MTTVNRRSFTLALALCALAFTAAAARAAVHLMQIEQVIAGVNGDTSVQAIQLRMREELQDQMQASRLMVVDATGSNPIELIQFPAPVPNHGIGVRILAASANFVEHTDSGLTPDFILTNLIPESYLAAGSLTFEDLFGTIFWRLSWGGDAYTGPNDGAFCNDPDGDFGPPFAGPLPSTGLNGLLFNGSASALSTRNIDDYDLTPGAAEFTNNAGESGTIVGDECDACDMNCDGEVDAFDIEPFLDLLFGPGKPCGECTGDVNGDGDIDAFDIEPFLECLFG